MRYICLFLMLVPLAVSQAQYPQVELYQTTQDYYYYPVGTSYGFDYLGGRHLIEGRTNPDDPDMRIIFYNFHDLHGDSLGWTSVSLIGRRQTMEKLHIFPRNRAAVTFKYYSVGDHPMIAVDAYRGFGIFTVLDAPSQGIDPSLYRPSITDDAPGRFHMIYFSSGFPTYMLRYISWDGSNDPFGPVIVEDAVLPTAKIVTSGSSDRVALVFLRAVIEDNDEISGGDVAYVVSEDGENWDFENDIIYVTDYNNSDLRAFGDLDALFDSGDILHIVWNETILYDPGISAYDARLMHFTEREDRIDMISYNFDDEWDASPGHRNIGIGSMSLACDVNGHLYVAWEEFHDTDASNDGYCNGDIYLAYSFDDGYSWTPPANLTDSQTPDCQAGDCESDLFPDLDEAIDDEIRLFYLSDRDAGSGEFGEGEMTTNTTYMMTLSPRVSIDPEIRPQRFLLLQNYPNPFNARTTFKFSLAEAANVKLQIFDIAGRLVETLADCEFDAGENSVTWDATDQSSGIYFARLAGNTGSVSKKLVLLK